MCKNLFSLTRNLLWLFIASLAFVACKKEDDMPAPTENIVQFAQNNPDFSLLVEAAIKADLVGALGSPGPLTLFAPRNDAFQAFLDAAGTGSVANTPADVLRAVLTNHVVGGEFRAADLITGYGSTISPTAFGSNIFTSIYVNIDGGVTINGDARVINADVPVTNGVIHVVDKVIAPPTVVTFALADQNFSSLVAALTRAGLSTDFVAALTGEGPFTVFAPTNAAFQNLLNSNPAWNSLDDIPAAVLEQVLLYHVSGAGNVRSSNLSDGMIVPTLGGKTFSINLSVNPPQIVADQNTANIIFTDVQGTNGVIHVIDAVILPEFD
jgi:uncharacterized surface protein with fasciclin (FAS1) repeats